RRPFCFHGTFALAATASRFLKNIAFVSGQIGPLRRADNASHRARLSGTGTRRRAGVFDFSAATSMKPGRRVTSDHSSRRISSERSPAKAPNAKQIARSGLACSKSLASSGGVKISTGDFFSFRRFTLASKLISDESHPRSWAKAKKVFSAHRKLLKLRGPSLRRSKKLRTSSGVIETRSH